jgi:hypothetical protein
MIECEAQETPQKFRTRAMSPSASIVQSRSLCLVHAPMTASTTMNQRIVLHASPIGRLSARLRRIVACFRTGRSAGETAPSPRCHAATSTPRAQTTMLCRHSCPPRSSGPGRGCVVFTLSDFRDLKPANSSLRTLRSGEHAVPLRSRAAARLARQREGGPASISCRGCCREALSRRFVGEISAAALVEAPVALSHCDCFRSRPHGVFNRRRKISGSTSSAETRAERATSDHHAPHAVSLEITAWPQRMSDLSRTLVATQRRRRARHRDAAADRDCRQECQRLLNWNRARAAFWPYFLRSFLRGSRVT